LSDTSKPEKIDADAKIDVTFAELGLDPKILKALGDLGYVTPTPIQAGALLFAQHESLPPKSQRMLKITESI